MPVILARLLFLVIAALGIWAVMRLLRSAARDLRGGVRQRNGHATYQPGKTTTASAQAGGAGSPFIMSRKQADSLRDALTSAPIDPSQAIARCGQCQSMYHQTSLDALRASGRFDCVSCASKDLSPVLFSD